MDDKTREHALEYALILGAGAVLLAIVFLNIHSRIFM
jgi:Flp pilus assembly pilin Flp